MKKIAVIVLVVGFFFLNSPELKAQDNPDKKSNPLLVEEEGPLMFKFEPDFLSSVKQRKAKIEHTRAILDTLDVSERKRRRLFKDLYKNRVSERLSKALVVETKFEDPEANEN